MTQPTTSEPTVLESFMGGDWMIEPEDVLVIRVPSDFPAVAANELQARVLRAMPKLKDCLVIPGDDMRVYREGTNAPA